SDHRQTLLESSKGELPFVLVLFGFCHSQFFRPVTVAGLPHRLKRLIWALTLTSAGRSPYFLGSSLAATHFRASTLGLATCASCGVALSAISTISSAILSAAFSFARAYC